MDTNFELFVDLYVPVISILLRTVLRSYFVVLLLIRHLYKPFQRYGIHHRICNPLAPFSGFTEIMMVEGDEADFNRIILETGVF